MQDHDIAMNVGRTDWAKRKEVRYWEFFNGICVLLLHDTRWSLKERAKESRRWLNMLLCLKKQQHFKGTRMQRWPSVDELQDKLRQVGSQAYTMTAICNRPYIHPDQNFCHQTTGATTDAYVQVSQHMEMDNDEELRGDLSIG
eukprot:12195300-Ditylum_brightwellii.AAC.1